MCNTDQQLSFHSLKKLRREANRSLYLDEVIDCKFVTDSEALLCSNSESLKLLDLETHETKLLTGHTDIVLCIDIFNGYFLSGAKDNEIRLWHGERCVAVFRGHNENVTSVCFAPKNGRFFVSTSQDNTLKVWDSERLLKQSEGELREVNAAELTIMGH